GVDVDPRGAAYQRAGLAGAVELAAREPEVVLGGDAMGAAGTSDLAEDDGGRHEFSLRAHDYEGGSARTVLRRHDVVHVHFVVTHPPIRSPHDHKRLDPGPLRPLWAPAPPKRSLCDHSGRIGTAGESGTGRRGALASGRGALVACGHVCAFP